MIPKWRLLISVTMVTLALGSGIAQALEVGGMPLYADARGSWGYSSTSVTTGNTKPTLMQWGIGLTGAYQINDMFFAGLSSDFTFVGQYSDTAASGANYRGSRWNLVAPTVGAKISGITASLDLEFLGNYKLSKAALDGGSVSFKSPLGAKLRATYPVMEKIVAGAQFEYLQFSKIGNSVSGDVTLASKQTLWQAGLVAGYVF